jgi:hypothetical protein
VLVVLGSQCGLGWPDASKVIPGPQGDLSATYGFAAIILPRIGCTAPGGRLAPFVPAMGTAKLLHVHTLSA